MSSDFDPFTPEDLAAAAQVPMDQTIFLHALRTGTQALGEFGAVVIEPILAGQLNLTARESALGMTFYRLWAALRTLSDLRQPHHFQAIASGARLVFELCMDTHLIAHDKVENGAEKFHGFTRAARFSAAFKTTEFFRRFPEMKNPGEADERRALVETPGGQAEIEALNRSLWDDFKPPAHWSGLRWEAQARLCGQEFEKIQCSGYHYSRGSCMAVELQSEGSPQKRLWRWKLCVGRSCETSCLRLTV